VMTIYSMGFSKKWLHHHPVRYPVAALQASRNAHILTRLLRF